MKEETDDGGAFVAVENLMDLDIDDAMVSAGPVMTTEETTGGGAVVAVENLLDLDVDDDTLFDIAIIEQDNGAVLAELAQIDFSVDLSGAIIENDGAVTNNLGQVDAAFVVVAAHNDLLSAEDLLVDTHNSLVVGVDDKVVGNSTTLFDCSLDMEASFSDESTSSTTTVANLAEIDDNDLMMVDDLTVFDCLDIEAAFSESTSYFEANLADIGFNDSMVLDDSEDNKSASSVATPPPNSFASGSDSSIASSVVDELDKHDNM